MSDPADSWARFQENYLPLPELGMALDLSLMNYPDSFLSKMEPDIQRALQSMADLEGGGIANPDENRMVGHYWLRDPSLAPTGEITAQVNETLERIKRFSEAVHREEIVGEAGPFRRMLIIGIGGSALGPQFVSQALARPEGNPLQAEYFDNTDPDGIDLVLSRLRDSLGETLVIVISKSGGTPETRNGMIEAKHVFETSGLSFAKHAVAVTEKDSKLDRYADSHGWLLRLPIWDWVGGRTSETGPVGLLPAALEGISIDDFLRGAATMDEVTRRSETRNNPAALLALMWYYATEGIGTKDMVIIPYKDRLRLVSNYLQQLVMESLGKELDLDGKVVNQGIAVYGNKGSTAQHAYIQQLRDGLSNFFVTFIEVLKSRDSDSIEVESGSTSGDFLIGFLLGTRSALYERNRESITISMDELNPSSIGALIALFERAVGLYAVLINVNAYHQPGVEAGKKAAATFLDLNRRIHHLLKHSPGRHFTAESVADTLDCKEEVEIVFKLLEHLAANRAKGIHKIDSSNISLREYYFEQERGGVLQSDPSNRTNNPPQRASTRDHN